MFITRQNDTMVDCLLTKAHVNIDDFIRAEENLDHKIADAMRIFRQASPLLTRPGAYVGTSGGKDSVVVTWLANEWRTLMGKANLPLVHTPKPGVTHLKTIEFLYSLNDAVAYIPKELHNQFGFTTQVDGTRISEYNRTDGRSTDLVVKGENVSRENMKPIVEDGLFGLSFVYPIYDWTDADVWALIINKCIPFSQEYLE